MLLRRLSAPLYALAVACTASSAAPGTPPGGGGGGAGGPVSADRAVRGTPLMLASGDATQLAGPAEAPWSLTASDGSGLLLTRVDAKAVVEGPLALTELHLYFHNPEARIREGTFAITLPPGAALSRFAMEGDNGWMEAEVVEKAVARRAYEDFLHRRQDPALLEKAEGNQFSARVFPIPAKGDKHLVITFSQALTAGYALPLRGLAKTERIDATVKVARPDGGFAEHALHERNWQPDRDLTLPASATTAAAISVGELVAARVKIELPAAEARPTGMTVLIDTSASRALGFPAEVRAVRELCAALARRYGGALPITVAAFDQGTTPIYDGRADGFGDGAAKALLAHRALGASDLGQALAWAGAHAHPRVVVISDAMITAGDRSEALPAAVKALGGHRVERLDVLVTGGLRDEALAGSLARGGLAQAGAVLDLDAGVDEAARRLGVACATELPVKVAGATWAFPRTIAAAQAGDEVVVYARVPQVGRTAGAIDVAIGDGRHALAPLQVDATLLGRAVAGAEIAELEAKVAVTRDATARTALRAELARRSVAARVVSSETAMLVLESDADYERYHIPRNALADILVVDAQGVGLAHRAAPVVIAAPVAIADRDPWAGKQGGKAKAKNAEVATDTTTVLNEDHDEAKDGKPADDKEQVAAATRGALAVEEAEKSAAPAPGSLERVPAAPPPPPAWAEAPRPEPAMAASNGVASGAALGQAIVGPGGAGGASDRRDRAEYRVADRRRAVAGDADAARGLVAEPPAERWSPPNVPALTGELASITATLAAGQRNKALADAWAWRERSPGDVLALIALGDASEANHDAATAARAYGSIIDLYPARADFRRFAGERLARLGAATAALQLDTLRRAVEERPDHLSGHRLLAYALVRAGQYAEAFDAILAGLDQPYPAGRFAGGERVLQEDAAMIGAAYLAHAPARRAEILAALAKRQLAVATRPSTRFVLYWETDDNDVDFHIQDARGNHAFYAAPQLASGGALYADVTTGYGPECFTIDGTPKGGPYHLSINYYSQGPMGYGMGLLEAQRFDGRGGLTFEDRPYVIMTNQAFVDLGVYR